MTQGSSRDRLAAENIPSLVQGINIDGSALLSLLMARLSLLVVGGMGSPSLMPIWSDLSSWVKLTLTLKRVSDPETIAAKTALPFFLLVRKYILWSWYVWTVFRKSLFNVDCFSFIATAPKIYSFFALGVIYKIWLMLILLCLFVISSPMKEYDDYAADVRIECCLVIVSVVIYKLLNLSSRLSEVQG